MYCSICGSPAPRHGPGCPVATGGSIRERAGGDDSPARTPEGAVSTDGTAWTPTCQRCAYHGQGLRYFSRGTHVAALVAATFFTLPYALGAGGLLYYGLRRDHLICPRCGIRWGKYGQQGLAAPRRWTVPEPRMGRASPAGENLRRAWSMMLFLVGGVALVAGAVQLELILLVLGALTTTGGVILRRGANEARERRREALIASLQTEVVRLAGERGGALTVTEAAAALGWTLARAQKILHSLDDGWRVDSAITDEGVIVYEFRELLLKGGRSPGS